MPRIEWADCSCCYPQKPFIRKAVGWFFIPGREVPPFWYVDIGGWPRGCYETWEDALAGARRYLERGVNA